MEWDATAELVTRSGKGPRRLRPVDAGLSRRGNRTTSGAAGHAGAGDGSQGSDCGPLDDAAGHGCGPDPWEQARLRAVAHLDRAARYRAWLDEAPGRLAAELAKREGLSRARVSQTLCLVDLPPEVVTDLRRSDRTGPVPTEKELREIATMKDRWNAMERYRKLVGQDPEVAPVPRGPKQRGFSHWLELARRYQAMLDSGEHLSLSSIGRTVGVTAQRVGQVLNLLQLAPEIIAVIDVPAERLPATMTSKAIRAIAVLRDKGEQRRVFDDRWPGRIARGVAA